MRPRRHLQEHPTVYVAGTNQVAQQTIGGNAASGADMPPIKEDIMDTTYNENPPAFAPAAATATSATATNDLPVAEAVVYDVHGSKV